MSLAKPFLTITSITVAAIFGGGVYMMMNISSIAQQITERMATEALGVPVTMNSLDLSLQDKRATVQGLRIGNPEGFKKPYAVTIDTINIALNSVTKELVRFKDISVDGTNVNLEVTEKGTNLQAIQKNMPQKQETETSAEDEYVQPVKVIINRLSLTKAKLNPSVTLLNDQDLNTVTVPDIRLSGIGEKENGILAREAIAQIWSSLSKKFSATAANSGFYKGLSSEMLKDLGASQIESIKGKIGDGVNKVGEKFRGLF